MKKGLIGVVILLGAYLLATNFPNGTYDYEWDNSAISLRITDDHLAFKDPVCRKHIIIRDDNQELDFSYWAETYPLKIYKRKNGTESFWVIDDYYRGISRSENGKFQDFLCSDCSGIEATYGTDILEFQFENKKLTKIEKN